MRSLITRKITVVFVIPKRRWTPLSSIYQKWTMTKNTIIDTIFDMCISLKLMLYRPL